MRLEPGGQFGTVFCLAMNALHTLTECVVGYSRKLVAGGATGLEGHGRSDARPVILTKFVFKQSTFQTGQNCLQFLNASLAV
jgi:hypothetical protein